MAKQLTYADPASQEMLDRAATEQIETIWDRYEAMQPQCGFGKQGICCKNCTMGPCRISKKAAVGVCGATAETIAARNIARMIAGGTAAHTSHGRQVVHTLLLAASDPDSDYKVKSPEKLKTIAEFYGIATEGREIREIAFDLAKATLEEFGRQEGELRMAASAPEPRQKLWRELGIIPRGIDREIVETMNRTTMGVDADYKNIIRQGMRTALANGWGGSMLATELQDALFGTPNPLRGTANLGVLKKDTVNVLVHGHEPTLSDIIAAIAQDKKLVEKAKDKGASGITVAGICCTANEILMRHGIPVAGSFLQQELAIMTGAVDAMVVDVQCVLPGLTKLSDCFHTKIITTSPTARIPGASHVEFREDRAIETATEILEQAIENFPARKAGKVHIPEHTERLVAGFTAESVFDFLGGKYRATYRPLNDAIMTGRLRGAVGVVGCSSPNVDYEKAHLELIRELIRNDTLVVATGCSAITCAKHGLLRPEASFEHAGQGLQEICRAVGIPPVLHLGACVDNTRILRVLTHMVAEGGLGSDLSDLPVAGAAMEWMSEKAVAIGFYFVASGVYTLIGHPLPMMGSLKLHRYLTEEIEAETGGKWAFELDPMEAAHKILRHVDGKRKALKLKPMMYPQPFEPEK